MNDLLAPQTAGADELEKLEARVAEMRAELDRRRFGRRPGLGVQLIPKSKIEVRLRLELEPEPASKVFIAYTAGITQIHAEIRGDLIQGRVVLSHLGAFSRPG